MSLAFGYARASMTNEMVLFPQVVRYVVDGVGCTGLVGRHFEETNNRKNVALEEELDMGNILVLEPSRGLGAYGPGVSDVVSAHQPLTKKFNYSGLCLLHKINSHGTFTDIYNPYKSTS
ncbi:MAG TPA: hypothetical protein VGO47_00160 [Chlamydiales bacterium]|nr:hypothetical protein [Chlamydiales bacterium]